MKLIAWVKGEDIRAVRTDDGEELLMVDGEPVPLTEADHSPVQLVINYCRVGVRVGVRKRAAMRRAWTEGRA